MGCRCAERRQQIATAGQAIVRGDVKTVVDQADRFAQSVKDDLRDLRSRIARGRQSLTRRR